MTRICPQCKKSHEAATFCPFCGAKVSPTQPPLPREKSQIFNDEKLIFYGKIFIGGTILILIVYAIIFPYEYQPSAISSNCDFVHKTEKIYHIEPNGAEMLQFALIRPYQEQAKPICIINMNGSPIEIEGYRDEGDGKTFQADHLQIKKVLLTSKSGSNVIEVPSPGGNVGMIVKITNPNNVTSNVQIVVTGVTTH